MENSKKIKSLWIAIILLILINLSAISWQWFSRRSSQDDQLSPERIERTLHFNQQQVLQFTAIKDDHFLEVIPIRDSIRIIKSQLFDYLKKGKIDSRFIDVKMNKMVEKIRENEIKTLHHFAKIRAICTPEQKIVFDNDILERFKKQGPNGTGHPPERERPPKPENHP